MQYKLKQNEAPFEVVDGPMTGSKFTREGIYNDIPAAEAHKFSEVKDQPSSEKPSLDNESFESSIPEPKTGGKKS